MSNRLELQKQAQEKLVEAERLIKEAGQLAKEGQFVLHVGEIGTFIPKRYKDPELYRDEAIEILKLEGWEYYDRTGRTTITRPWSELEADPELLEEAVGDTIETLIDQSDVPSEYREYGPDEGPDKWWHPSRC